MYVLMALQYANIHLDDNTNKSTYILTMAE